MQPGKGYGMPKSGSEAWRTRGNVLAPEGLRGKAETHGEEATFEE